MSDNKFKYFTVESLVVVKANNKTDAEKLAMGRKRVKSSLRQPMSSAFQQLKHVSKSKSDFN
jgi:hypothetical protein